jgi:hypothetical protein
MSWELPAIAIFLLFTYALPCVPTYGYFFSPVKRRAMRLAFQFVCNRGEDDIRLSRSGVVRCDAEKCFVFFEHKCPFRTPLRSGYVVWHTGHIDELGTWQLHWGLTAEGPIEAYEWSRAAGIPWPTNALELIRWSKQLNAEADTRIEPDREST